MNPFKIKKGLGRGLSSLIGDSGISKSQTKISIGSISVTVSVTEHPPSTSVTVTV